MDPTAVSSPEPVTAKPQKNVLTELYEWVEVFAASIAVVFLLFVFVGRVSVVDGKSMTNTLQDGDKLFVWQLFYRPKPGDIVVCQSDFFGFGEPLVKRVIATAGQTITLDTDTWTVRVDGVALDEPYVLRVAGRAMHGWSYGESYTVPEGYVFVMGDNRNGSWDSRDVRVGPIKEQYVVGKVVFRYAPLSSFGKVS